MGICKTKVKVNPMDDEIYRLDLELKSLKMLNKNKCQTYAYQINNLKDEINNIYQVLNEHSLRINDSNNNVYKMQNKIMEYKLICDNSIVKLDTNC